MLSVSNWKWKIKAGSGLTLWALKGQNRLFSFGFICFSIACRISWSCLTAQSKISWGSNKRCREAVLSSVFVGSNRKIDPNRRSHLKADGTPDLDDRVKSGQPNWHLQNGNRLGYVFLTCSLCGTIVCLDCSSKSSHMIVQDCCCLIR